MQQKIKEVLKYMLIISLRILRFVVFLVISAIFVIILSVLYALMSLLDFKKQHTLPYALILSILIVRFTVFDLLVSEEFRGMTQGCLGVLLVASFLWGYVLEFEGWIRQFRNRIYQIYKRTGIDIILEPHIKSFSIIIRKINRRIIRILFVTELLGFIGVLMLSLSKWMAGRIINLYIPVDPTRFPVLLEIFTYLALIIVIFYFSVIILVILSTFFLFNFFVWYFVLLFKSIAMLFYLMPKTIILFAERAMKNGSPSPEGNEFKNIFMKEMAGPIESLVYNPLRVFGSAATAFLLSFAAQKIYDGINYVLHFYDPDVSHLIAIVGHYEHGFCENYDPNQGERMAQIGENLISVAVPDRERGGYKFEIRSCNLGLIYRHR